MATAPDDGNTQLKSLISVELLLLIEYGILFAFPGAALFYLRHNQSVAFKGDATAARKIILPSFEPFLWIISGVTGALFGFFMLSLLIGLYKETLPAVPYEVSYAGRQFVFLIVLVFIRQKSVSIPALRRSVAITLVLSAYTIPVAWYTKSANVTPWSLRGARLVIILFYGYAALFPTSRASKRTLREYCGVAIVFHLLLLTSNLFEDADNEPAVLTFQCVGVIWSSLCLIVLWRVLRADTEYWRGMGQRVCDAQMAIIRNRHKTKGNRHFHERISSQGLHVLIEMHRKYIIDFAYLKIKQKIGVGSSAEVFSGILHSRVAVAVKVYTPVEFTDETVVEFSHEAALCGALLHPNIVTFYGMCISPPTICLVSELCQGSLEDVTCANARRSLQPTKQFLLNLTLMLDAARAVAYLHSFSPAFLHRDIKPSNFLVDTDFNVKLTDFGESRSVQQGSNFSESRKIPGEFSSESTRASGDALSMKMTVRGTVDYMAPELITGKAGLALYGEAADVYALGMTMWDILYPGREKYPELKNSHLLVFEAVLQGKRPRFYTKPNDQLRQIIEDTWHADARLRPSAENIVNVLETIQEEMLANFSSELMEHMGVHFIGGSAVHRMQELKFVSTPGEAIRLGNALMDAGFVHHHKHKKPFENSSQCRYYIDESSIILCRPFGKGINHQGWIQSEVAPPPTNKRDGRKFSNVAESLAAHWMPRTSTGSDTQSLGPSERGRILSEDQSLWSEFAGGQLCACRRLGQRLEQHSKRPRRGLRQKVRARLEENQLTANLLANENTLKGYEPTEPDVLLLEDERQAPRPSSITIV